MARGTQGGRRLPQLARHARADLTIAERLDQLEIDMTAVHDAVGTLAGRLDQIEQLLDERDASHAAVVQAQVERADGLIARLKQEQPAGQAPETSSAWQEASASGLMDS